MSDVTQLKQRLAAMANDSKQAASSLAGFKQRFDQQSSQVQALIQGTATKADDQILQILAEAAKAVETASASLQVAAKSCTNYADGV
ncbi:MAG: hypothetical protein ACRDS9_08285 [Pseudonocardiaceae bacterium]